MSRARDLIEAVSPREMLRRIGNVTDQAYAAQVVMTLDGNDLYSFVVSRHRLNGLTLSHAANIVLARELDTLKRAYPDDRDRIGGHLVPLTKARYDAEFQLVQHAYLQE